MGGNGRGDGHRRDAWGQAGTAGDTEDAARRAPGAAREPRDSGVPAEVARACDGLLFPSETDAPVTPLLWPQATMPALTPAALLAREGLAADTPVEAVGFDAFFDGYDPAQGDPADPEQRETLTRLQALRAALASALTGLTVFRAGRVDIGVYVLGLTPAGDVAGVQTRVVET